ncbi:helix-turn-helix domain-containing protein [Nocardia abscessus]|uniref:helix-turn-helix domain-containing protein n=1 Tax=Nocardia abscessus TaxID=120957 RepID=UPI003CC7D46D
MNRSNLATTVRSRDTGSSTPLSPEVRQLLRSLGTLALKVADEEAPDPAWLSNELDRTNVSQQPNYARSDLLTVTEAHTRLRISKWSIYKLIHQRELDTIKIGARRFVPNSEIEHFLRKLSAGYDV